MKTGHTATERQRLREKLTEDWTRSTDELIELLGPRQARRVLLEVRHRAAELDADPDLGCGTPYVNTIGAHEQPTFAGDEALEDRLEAWVRWNAMAMVVGANRRLPGIGGHLSTHASAATLFEVGFNHFFRGKDHPEGGDQVYFQGHASPGVYARAYLEGRLDEGRLLAFRRELEGGLSSYPHPWSMPGFWEFPTVSMGLGALCAVHQARFDHYLEARGLVDHGGRVWALLGDGEMDEPEATAGLSLAAREGLDNLVFVVNCNLQRLDGPVRGNGKILQELERRFSGAGWHVIKVVWSSAWDPLLDDDHDGVLLRHMERTCDGDWQRIAAGGPDALRREFFGQAPELEALLDGRDEAVLARLGFGGHDRRKVQAALAQAERQEGRPTVVLAKTVKGHLLGSHEARNDTHKAKVLDHEEVMELRDRLGLPISDGDLAGDRLPFRRPAPDSPEARYLRERREELGGPVPERRPRRGRASLTLPNGDVFEEAIDNFTGKEATTTVCLVRLLGGLGRLDGFGERLVPIVPDEARTFGIEALFPRLGIYAPGGQRYRPVDAGTLLSYEERADGQILEEGITEAGAMASTIAAGTAHANHGVAMVPFWFFYSMFGFQRVGDLIWAAQDARARGFLIGATAGRTTLNGEGLQHQDGHSHLLSLAHPAVRSFDPAFGYEVVTIVRHGLHRMHELDRDELFYVTVHNEPFVQPPMPVGCEEGVVRGMYLLCGPSEAPRERDTRGREFPVVQLLASGPIVRQALSAQERLRTEHGLEAAVWSVTSWQELHRDALATARWNRRHPVGERRLPWLQRCLGSRPGPVVAVSDFTAALPATLGPWLGPDQVLLGADGFGRSDGRAALRDYFGIDSTHLVAAAHEALVGTGRIGAGELRKVREALGLSPGLHAPPAEETT
ncbi:MAG: pyruvate dehydrogenase (acetyl-transferring), homodimeric type [Planctomycetota bacterium]